MKNIKLLFYSIIFCFFITIVSCSNTNKVANTTVSIKEEAFYINDKITYEGRYWNNHKIEGLLFNSRMVQGIFDDTNPETKKLFGYPDNNIWDPNRNTQEFINSMPDWKSHGLLAFTLNLQGGSPTGYGNKNWINTTFDSKGNLKPAYLERLESILNKADELGMVVILGYFYFGQDQLLENETAVVNAVDNITEWIIEKGYKNILIEINNECDIQYDHEILKPKRVDELIKRVKKLSNNTLLAGTSFSGNALPTPNVIEASDFILIHGNGANSEDIKNLVVNVRKSETYTPKPIIYNEDDHYNFDKESYNFLSAIENYASWGFFDFRRDGEGFEEGYQSVPVDWKINSKRKKDFFNKLKEITGY